MVGSGMKEDVSGVLVLGVAATDCGGVLEVDWAVRLGEELEDGARLASWAAAGKATEETGGVGVLYWMAGGLAAVADVLLDELLACFGSLMQAPIVATWIDEKVCNETEATNGDGRYRVVSTGCRAG